MHRFIQKTEAPVVQWIELRIPVPSIGVRLPTGVQVYFFDRMKRLFTLLCVSFVTLLFSAELLARTYFFDWSDPTSLTPSFPAPDANNRYGEYISNVAFQAGPVTFTVNDDGVAQGSQKARFLWAYMTRIVEMRAYDLSVVHIEVPDSLHISCVRFEGAKVSDVEMDYMGTDGTFTGNVWNASTQAVHSVDFFVYATINCTLTSVEVDEIASVEDLDNNEAMCTVENETRYYNSQGIEIKQPQKGTFVIKRVGNKVYKQIMQ